MPPKGASIKLFWWYLAASWMLLPSYTIYVADDEHPPKYCTVFGHMVKSGGTTIKWALDTAQPADQRQPGLCVFAVHAKDRCREVATDSTIVEGYSELARVGLENAGRRDCEYFTMLRHPVDRLVSQFFYCPTDHDVQHRPLKWCGSYKHDKDPLKDRLLEFATRYWGNHCLQMMLIGTTCPPQPKCPRNQMNPTFRLDTPEDWKRLEKAKAILGTYNAVGILEHWDLSMMLFDARVKSPVARWVDRVSKTNAGRWSPVRQQLLRWAYRSEAIRGVVKGDLLLYEHGLALFKRQTAEPLGMVWVGIES